MGRPCFTFYLRPQIIQAVENDPSDRDELVTLGLTDPGVGTLPVLDGTPAAVAQGV